MRFAYRLTQLQKPAVAIGGRWVRPHAMVDVSITGPSNTRTIEGKLDTAADDTVFPEWMAARIGVDLTNAPTGELRGVGPGVVSVRYAQVILRIADTFERREWTAWVAFTSIPLSRALLGFGGFLQFFGAHFLGDAEEVELTANRLYPGT